MFPYSQPQEVETEEDGDEGGHQLQGGTGGATYPIRRCLNCTADLEGYDGYDGYDGHGEPAVESAFFPCEECGHDPKDDAKLFDGTFPVHNGLCQMESLSGGSMKDYFVLAYDERMLLHSEEDPETSLGETFQNSGHPERPDRLRAVMARLQRSGVLKDCRFLPGREATNEELERCHSTELMAQIAAASQLSAMSNDAKIHLKPDTYVNAHTSLCARLSAGACVDVTLAVVSGAARSGIAICRPPGHHAESNTAMGFCFYNNAAVAARAAQAAGVKRIMIFDWDVHHGNGTQHIFEDDPDVLYASIHRYDHGNFYPGTGSPAAVGGVHEQMARGTCVNIGWPHGGMGDAEYMAAMNHVILPITASFAPDLIILSAGFDAAEGDPIGGCHVSPQCYAHMAAGLQAHAPTVALLEGGYNLKATAACTESTVRALLGQRPVMGSGVSGGGKLSTTLTSAGGMMAVAQALRIQAEFWPCLGALRSAFDQFGYHTPMEQLDTYPGPLYAQHIRHLDENEEYDGDDYNDYDDCYGGDGNEEGGGEGEGEGEETGGLVGAERASTPPWMDDDVMTSKTCIP